MVNENSNLERENDNLKNEIKLFDQELTQLGNVAEKLKTAEEELNSLKK